MPGAADAEWLPRQLEQKLIASYSSPGDHVRINRDHDSDANVVPLHRGPADLLVYPLDGDPRPIAEAAPEQLAPNGFLALVLPANPQRDHSLGQIVAAFQAIGLRYWQHVVAVDPTAPTLRTTQTSRVGARRGRAHRDLLVFHRAAAAATQAAARSAA